MTLGKPIHFATKNGICFIDELFCSDEQPGKIFARVKYMNLKLQVKESIKETKRVFGFEAAWRKEWKQENTFAIYTFYGEGASCDYA